MRIRLFVLSLCPLLLLAAIPPAVSLADGDEAAAGAGFGAATPEELAERVLQAWIDRDPDELVACTQPGDMRELAAEDGHAGMASTTVTRFRIGNVWIRERDAWVQYEWDAEFDRDGYEEAEMARIAARAAERGLNEMATQLMQNMARQHIDRTADQITFPVHIMRAVKIDGRWYAINRMFDDQRPSFDPSYNPAGVEIGDYMVVTDPDLVPAEHTCGGSSPEALTCRVINAWANDNTIDVVWCARPGDPRAHYARQDRTMITCINVEWYRLKTVWAEGNMAWVLYEWTCRFDRERYLEHERQRIERQMEEVQGPGRAQLERSLRLLPMTIHQLAERVERREQILQIAKIGDRYYLAGAFVVDEPPDIEPLREADNSNNPFVNGR